MHTAFFDRFFNGQIRGIAVAAATLAVSTLPAGASGFALKAIHVFCKQAGCPDGGQPLSGLIMDKAGVLYGTANVGGKFEAGLIYSLTPQRGTYQRRTIYDFCLHTNCTDGSYPYADLVQDVDGNFYGTTGFGGAQGGGVVFRLSPKKRGWAYTVLYAFCSQANCTDGENSSTRLSYAGQIDGKRWDRTSPLFGTTYAGGANGHGVSFELTRNGSQWNYAVIHDQQNTNYPNPVLVGPDGTLFVTTFSGAANGYGNFYMLKKDTWEQTIIHAFCPGGDGCVDGANPTGTLSVDGKGNVFGVALSGGAYGHGVAFEHPVSGGFSVIYDFCTLNGCLDGDFPNNLSQGPDSNSFYGTAGGGKNQMGVVFKLAHRHGKWSESVVKAFCPNGICKAGSFPSSSLVQDSLGNVFGTTYFAFGSDCNGADSCLTAFELKK